jgi:hypothetical protein
VSDQLDTTGKTVASAAEGAAAQVREQAEAAIASIAASDRLAKAKKTAGKNAKKVQKEAAKRSHHLTEEAAARGKAAAHHASAEAKKRSSAAIAGAPAVAKAARKKGGSALDAARERGGEVLLSALDTDPGKRIASTHAGTALKSKLTARRRRRRKLALLVIVNAGGAIAFKQLRSRKNADDAAPTPSFDGNNTASSTPTITVPPASVGTAAGEPLAGVAEEAVAASPEVEEQTEAPAVTAGEDGQLAKEGE